MFANDRRFWNTIGDVERVLDHVGRALARRWDPSAGHVAPVNAWANQDAVVVTSEVPGVDPASVGITMLDDVLTISGKRAVSGVGAQTGRGADFERSIQLPFRVDPDRTEARVANGVLTVTVHRPEAEKPRKIQVAAA